MSSRRLVLLALLPVVLLELSCRPKGVTELAREELYSLGIGKMDSQIDLFQLEGAPYADKTRIIMRDGLFYIANGASKKVMGLSSYGDLFFLLYNPEVNPPPVSISSGAEDNVSATRRAVPYAFHRLGEIAVDSGKRLYVEDTVPEERQVRDRELKALLDRVVLRFDRQGQLLDFIGQEGIGGTPFPYIESIWVTVRDELVVVCRTPSFWEVFWYSPPGSLRYQVTIDEQHLPLLQDAPQAQPSVGKLVPDLDNDALHVMLYYYGGTAENPTESVESPPSYAARIYRLNLRTGLYESHVEVPQDGIRKERVGVQDVEIPPPSYELLGTSVTGAYFLLRREDANLFQLLILDPGGREIARRYLVMEDSELYFKDLRLSATGIIYALLGEEYSAKVVWWRSDRLLERRKE